MHSYLSMNLFATFAFLLPGHPTLSTTCDYLKQRKKTAEKIDTNAQWFHCSWSILLKRVNIRVRGFHLVFLSFFVSFMQSLWFDFHLWGLRSTLLPLLHFCRLFCHTRQITPLYLGKSRWKRERTVGKS